LDTPDGSTLFYSDNYQLFRSWVATDAFGNTVTHEQTVVVSDLTPPNLFSHDGVALELGATDAEYVTCEEIPPSDVIYAEDNCDDDPQVVMVEDVAPNGCENQYILSREYTATDRSGHTSSYTKVVSVLDVNPPLFEIPSDQSKDVCLYPPNDKHYIFSHPVNTLFRGIYDGCGGTVNVQIIKCHSNHFHLSESNNNDFSEDCYLVAGASEDKLLVAAETNGAGNGGRTYKVTARAVDACGLATTHERVIYVPVDEADFAARDTLSGNIQDCLFANKDSHEYPPIDPSSSHGPVAMH
jgi:hypothetical protein